MRKTILLLLLLMCVVLFCCGAKGCYDDSSVVVDIDDIPVCDSDQTPQECEDAIETMPEG